MSAKTPDEIKMGLECDKCKSCPYGKQNSNDGDYHCHEVEPDALALIQQLEAQVPRWISVEERLPDKVEDVLVHSKGRIGIGCYFKSTNLWANDSFHSWDITHWMPLPEPPEEENK